MGTISLKSSLPSWAQPLSQRAQNIAQVAADREQLPDSLYLENPQPEVTTRDIGAMRDYSILLRGWDEDPEHDKALGKPGVIVGNGFEARFQGNSLNGSLDITSEHAVSRFRYDGHQVDYQFLERDCDFETGRLNLADTGRSFKLTTESPHNPTIPVPKSTYFEATTRAADALQAIPENSDEVVFREVFLDGRRSMVDVRRELQRELKAGIDGLDLADQDKAKLKSHFEAPNAGTPRRLYRDLKAQGHEQPKEALRELTEKAGLWQALEDFPKLQADGISRSCEYYLSPQHLTTQTAALGWDFDNKTGLPIADTIVVGGGPGGLASTYHLSERGTRVVLFEGGHIGQGFSDAGAKSVHQLRTNGAASNLIYTANTNQLGVDVSLQRHLGETRKKCKDAREDWYHACDEKEHGVSFANGDEVSPPANRAELFEHMAHVAHGLALNYPDTLVSENCPVTSIEKIERGEGKPHLYKVSTENGHQVLARSLVMATGFVGGDGEHARSLKLFEPLHNQNQAGVTVLRSDHDLIRNNDRIENDALVLSERLLGRPEIRDRIKKLPPGSRIAVIGGGESATKGALEALHLNSEIKLDLYTADPLEPYQTQIPSGTLAYPITESAIRHPEVAQRTIERMNGFQTPVTADTLHQLFEFEAAGRVRIRELGERFNQSSVDVSSNGSGSIQVRLKSVAAEENLKSQRRDWVELGLYENNPPTDAPEVLPSTNMVIVAAGYDKRSLRAGPLIQQLQDQGLVELSGGEVVFGQDGLTSAQDRNLAFNTAGAVAMASDTAIPARAIRAYRLADNFDGKLPAREIPQDKIPSRLPYGNTETDSDSERFNWEKERALTYIDHGGVNPDELERSYQDIEKLTDPAERVTAKSRIDARRVFPGPNSALASLMVRASEAPESLSPSERLLWERAKQVTERLPQKVD